MAQDDEFVRVATEVPVDRLFDYRIPEHLRGKIQAGHRLKVPWGARQATVYAVSFPDRPAVDSCREVLAVVDREPLVPSSLMRLAEWMASYYCCDFSLALKAVLPEVVRGTQDGFARRLWVGIPSGLEESEVRRILSRSPAQWRAWWGVYQRQGGWMADLSRELEVRPTVWRALSERHLVVLRKEPRERNPLDGTVVSSRELELNAQQAAALALIEQQTASPTPQPILLQGVTGSGKTEVYLRALAAVLRQGRDGLILVPEISLTPQTVQRFRARFEQWGVRIAVLHSHLSAGERHDQWHLIRKGVARVVVGARSAVFAPLARLGLIIVDEEHEPSYKQEEAPHYHARDVAVMRARLDRVPVVLGSATPSLESVWNSRQGKYVLARLDERVSGARLPFIHVVDLRREKMAEGGAGLISSRLAKAVLERKALKQQSIFLLNRRGFAATVQCEKCGRVEECPHCSVPLTYHRSDQTLRCHFCDYREPVREACSACGHPTPTYRRPGTQRLEDALAAALPGIRWKRMDSDTMGAKHAYYSALEAFGQGHFDLLLGTQMIAKGLDFPSVTCVGVIHSDATLNLPDFRAGERVFQLLVQVAGRAGRGEDRGEVFIQTFAPFHPAIQFARHHDVDGFIEQELEFRRAHLYPPFSRFILLTFRCRSRERAEFSAQQAVARLRTEIEAAHLRVEVADAGPAPIEKIRDLFRFQVFLKTTRVQSVVPLLNRCIRQQTWPEGVSVDINVDPIHLL